MKTLRFRLLALTVPFVATVVRAATLIYPVEAIDDLWQLPADEFKTKYAGINISGIGPSDEGWYVRYKHENLTYLFGPLPNSDDARKKKWELETVRDAAIRNRQTLTSSKVDYVKFSYSGVYGKGGGNTPYSVTGNARISKDGRSGPDGDLDGDGIPNAKDDDMDGDGIPNDKDPDIDGDGIPNEKDDYAFGTFPGKDGLGGMAKDGSGTGDGDGEGGDGSGKDGKGGKAGKDGKGGKDGNGNLAGTDGGDGGDGAGGDGSQGGSKGSKGGKKGGTGGAGGDGSDGSGTGGQQGGTQKVASAGGSRSGGGQQGGQSGQSGSQGGQSGQSGGQSGGSSGGGGSSSGQSGQSGGSSGGPSGGGSGGGGNPLALIGSLLKAILGL